MSGDPLRLIDAPDPPPALVALVRSIDRTPRLPPDLSASMRARIGPRPFPRLVGPTIALVTTIVVSGAVITHSLITAPQPLPPVTHAPIVAPPPAPPSAPQVEELVRPPPARVEAPPPSAARAQRDPRAIAPGAPAPQPPNALLDPRQPASELAYDESAAPATETSSLAEELHLVERARDALGTDPALALRLAAEHKRRFAHGALAQERDMVTIDALVGLGRRADAERRARRFRAAYPGSVHSARIDQVLGQSTSGREPMVFGGMPANPF